MAFAYETVTPSLVPNTTMVKAILDGVPKTYRITPNDGYVLHDTNYDTEVLDRRGNPTGEIIKGYIPQTCSCSVNYDFAVTAVIDGYNALGSREFFARPQSEVPANQIFTITNPNPPVEVMGEGESEAESETI